MFKKTHLFWIVAVIISGLSGCKGSKGSNKVYKDQVVVHGLSDAKGLNPQTTSDAYAQSYIDPNIFQSLLSYDHATMKLVPVLATSRAEVVQNGDLVDLTFELRPEAVWDNGTPVTVDDVLFSFKSSGALRQTRIILNPVLIMSRISKPIPAITESLRSSAQNT